MTSRSIALFLTLFLAAPLCCCGWHGVMAEPAEAVTCPMCQALAGEVGDEEECPCAKELIQRDLAPKMATPQVNDAWVLAPSNRSWQPLAQRDFTPAIHPRLAACPLTGPPRLFLIHGAWLW